LLISGSTGISRPLADPTKIAEYLAGDQQTRLRRRLESDVKSLLAFYTYGILHRQVRLRWGFLDEHLPVDWALPGDPSLHSILEQCRESGELVEIVLGSAPGWNEPWSRAIRTRILDFDFMTVTVQAREISFIRREEISGYPRPAKQRMSCRVIRLILGAGNGIPPGGKRCPAEDQSAGHSASLSARQKHALIR
jgi:hypothetical protein